MIRIQTVSWLAIWVNCAEEVIVLGWPASCCTATEIMFRVLSHFCLESEERPTYNSKQAVLSLLDRRSRWRSKNISLVEILVMFWPCSVHSSKQVLLANLRILSDSCLWTHLPGYSVGTISNESCSGLKKNILRKIPTEPVARILRDFCTKAVKFPPQEFRRLLLLRFPTDTRHSGWTLTSISYSETKNSIPYAEFYLCLIIRILRESCQRL